MQAPARVLSPGEVIEEELSPEQKQYEHDYKIRMQCPECRIDPPNIVEEYSAGDVVCGDCGLVLASHLIDTRSEWRTFSNDDQGGDDPSRVGDAANPLLEGSQLSTTIAFGEGAAARDLNRAQGKTSDAKDNRQLTQAYKEIGTLCDSHGMSAQVADTAKHYYKLAHGTFIKGNKNQQAVIASCIFLSCRTNQAGRTFKEVTSLTKVPKKEIGRTFKALEKFLKSKTAQGMVLGGVALLQTQYQNSQTTNPTDLANRYSNDLQLPNHVSIVAGECAALLFQGVLAGRSPLSVAAVAIYAISNMFGHKISSAQIGNSVGVSEGTIKTAYKAVSHETFNRKEWTDRGGKIADLPNS